MFCFSISRCALSPARYRLNVNWSEDILTLDCLHASQQLLISSIFLHRTKYIFALSLSPSFSLHSNLSFFFLCISFQGHSTNFINKRLSPLLRLLSIDCQMARASVFYLWLEKRQWFRQTSRIVVGRFFLLLRRYYLDFFLKREWLLDDDVYRHRFFADGG